MNEGIVSQFEEIMLSFLNNNVPNGTWSFDMVILIDQLMISSRRLQAAETSLFITVDSFLKAPPVGSSLINVDVILENIIFDEMIADLVRADPAYFQANSTLSVVTVAIVTPALPTKDPSLNPSISSIPSGADTIIQETVLAAISAAAAVRNISLTFIISSCRF